MSEEEYAAISVWDKLVESLVPEGLVTCKLDVYLNGMIFLKLCDSGGFDRRRTTLFAAICAESGLAHDQCYIHKAGTGVPRQQHLYLGDNPVPYHKAVWI